MRTCAKMEKLFVCMCLIITFMIENVSAASTNTSSISFSGYDFTVDSNLYSKTYVAGKYGAYQYNTASNQVTMYVTTRVWVCRKNDTKYEDVILLWTELAPQSYSVKGPLGIKLKYKAYPEYLLVQGTMPNGVEYLTSAPKTQTVSSSYTVGGSVAVEPKKGQLGVSGQVTISKNALYIQNQSVSGKNLFKINYDYKPSATPAGANFQYLHATTEQIGMIYVKSKTSKYTVNLQYTIDVGATSGIYIMKGGTSTSKITFSRTITTSF